MLQIRSVARRCVIVSLFCMGLPLGAAEPLKPTHADVVFAEVDGQKLPLNLYLPKQSDAKDAKRPPLVIYIHGGSWRAGSYKTCPVEYLAEAGFAVASIEYRFTNVAKFPAQIHDCKAAVRRLRANAEKYGYDATRIGVAGSSAGGHLAVLLGTSGDVADLEGDVGGNKNQSSRVQAIVDFYGPTDFVLRGKTHPKRANEVGSSTYDLLGGAAKDDDKRAARASGVTYVSADDPPLLILHGDKDTTVYLDQSESIRDAYQKAKLPVELIVVPGGGHGGKAFASEEYRRRIIEFFTRHLK